MLVRDKLVDSDVFAEPYPQATSDEQDNSSLNESGLFEVRRKPCRSTGSELAILTVSPFDTLGRIQITQILIPFWRCRHEELKSDIHDRTLSVAISNDGTYFWTREFGRCRSSPLFQPGETSTEH